MRGPNAVRLCKKLVQDVAEQAITPALVQMTVEGIATRDEDLHDWMSRP